MKTKFYFSILLLSQLFLCYEKTNAQSPNWLWAKVIGSGNDDDANSVAIDAYGNVYTTGSFQGTVDFDPGPGTFNITGYGIFILKLDGSGNFVWAKAMTGTSSESTGYSIALDAFGNVYITGYFKGTVDFDPDSTGSYNLTSTAFSNDIFILKLDSSGNFVWAKQIGGTSSYDWGTSITLDASGNVYTTGIFDGTIDFDPGANTFFLTSAGGNDIFISKLDNSGNFVWAKRMGGISVDGGYSITLDASGNVYTTGYFRDTVDFDPGPGVFFLNGTNYSCFISKLTSAGNFVWAKAFVGGDIVGLSIVIDASGNIYSTGVVAGGGDFDPGAGTFVLLTDGGHDVKWIFVSKLNSSGNFVWAKVMGGTAAGSSGGFGYSVALDASGNVYTTGRFYGTVDFDPGVGTDSLTSAGGSDIFISKLNSSGNFVWTIEAGGVNDDYSMSVAINASGNAHVAGYFESPGISFGSFSIINADSTGNTSDIFIAKLDTLTTGIESVESNNVISVYPNPVKGLLVIRYSLLGNKNVSITITDITGKIIYSNFTEGAKITEVNTNNFPEGIYLVQIKSEDFIETKKIIVVK